MDLNEPPSAEDERDDPRSESADEFPRGESAVEIMRREREERRNRMQLKRKASGLTESPAALPPQYDRPVDTYRNFRSANLQLPEGWVECPNFGQPIAYVIPSKVPLGHQFNESIPVGKRYSMQQVVRQQRAAGREVGMVIDLTNTTRYYNAKELKDQGLRYVKIACRGRNEVPDNESVNTFVHEVTQYLEVRGRPKNSHILVHCTHGHNRTGFMIVHYIKRINPDTTVEQALKQFALARPPGIYKQEYIDKLFAFYNERRSDDVVCPSTPEWKRLAGVDLNGEAAGEEDDDGESDGGIMAALEGVAEETMTNDDVLGDAIPEMQQYELQKACYKGLHVGLPQSRGPYQFPGSQPVSLNSSNLQLLRQRYYYATWKADGTRYMMFIRRDGCYLVDRRFSFRRVQLRFPKRSSLTETQHGTLLDGEMVIDRIPETGQLKRRYLIYDIMMLNNESLVQLPFSERWKRIKSEIVDPRTQDAQSNRLYIYDMEPFRVRRKEFWLLSTTEKLLRDFIPKLPHEADGLIFQGWDDPYSARTNEGLLKWKYTHMNSVDFKFEVLPDGITQQLLLIDRGKLWPLDRASVIFPDGTDPSSYSGKIIECCWLPDQQKWEFMRIRTDKNHPNAVKTYRKVMESIEDNITEEVLLGEIKGILHLPMYQDRIQHDQRRLQRRE